VHGHNLPRAQTGSAPTGLGSPMSSPMTNSQFIDMIRYHIGLRPLSAGGRKGANGVKCTTSDNRSDVGARSYIRLQKLQNRANPDCKLCGGAGYNSGAAHDAEIPCRCLKAA
jgi:hypothetical protein